MRQNLSSALICAALLIVSTAGTALGRENNEATLRLKASLGERALCVHGEGGGKLTTSQSASDPTGGWHIDRVDINPDWTPPEGEWAQGKEYKPPGHPANPMGRTRLVFQPPYSIHGTDELDSIGKAASHGSIRLANKDVVELARRVLQADDSWESESWFKRMLDSSNEMRQIKLKGPVPIEITEYGSVRADRPVTFVAQRYPLLMDLGRARVCGCRRPTAALPASKRKMSEHGHQQRKRRAPTELLRQRDIGEPQREDFGVDRGEVFPRCGWRRYSGC